MSSSEGFDRQRILEWLQGISSPAVHSQSPEVRSLSFVSNNIYGKLTQRAALLNTLSPDHHLLVIIRECTPLTATSISPPPALC